MSDPIEGPVTYQSAAGGSRQLVLRGARSDNSTIVTVIDKNGGKFGLFLSDADVIDMALRILKAKAPHRLREPKFNELAPGTFIANRRTGQVAKVVAWSEELFPAWKEDGTTENEVFAVLPTGQAVVPWQDPEDEEDRWDIVEVEESTEIVWTPVGKA